MNNQIIQPGCYDYELIIKFPSTYIPEHTPPNFRNRASTQTTRTKNTYGQFDLSAPAAYDSLRDHFLQQAAGELMISIAQIELVRFDLKNAEIIKEDQ